jgi:TolA-binding protein
MFTVRFLPGALLALALSTLLPSASAQDPWAVRAADLRCKVQIASEPTSPDAGYIAIFPNGGELPGPYPSATVLDSAGKEVHSECLWNNPQEGYGIVFAQPANPGPLWIYLQGMPSPSGAAWSNDSALHPSLLLYTHTGHSTINDARNIAGEFPPTQGVRMGMVSIIGDMHNRFGSSENYSSYYTGWLDVPEGGDTFIGTISSDGSLVMIDGKVATEWPGLHSDHDGRTGKKGNVVSLTKGPHRVQYYHFFQGPADGKKPIALLVWRLPSMKKAPLPVRPEENNFTHSGTVTLIAAENRDGTPPAIFERRALSYMSFDNNQFVDLFEIWAPLGDKIKNYKIDWKFSNGLTTHGPDIYWPVVRGSPLSVTLTITGPNGSSSATRQVYPDILPEGASVDDFTARRDYAQALYNCLAGAPPGVDPATTWPLSYWQILPQVVRGGEAKDLLAFLFQHCPAGLANLSADDRTRLASIYYDELKIDTKTAPAVLQAVSAAEKDPAIQFQWQLKAVDFDLFETDDIADARKVAANLQPDTFRGGKFDAELKLIALGDVERMAGNTDGATQYYTSAQSMYQRIAGGGSTGAFNGFAGDMSRSNTPVKSKDGIVITAADSQNADWRKRAVVQNSYYEEVRNLLDQDELDDAHDKLQSWELQFPLNKLEGDYVIAEAEYAIKFEDYKRATRLLKAYRQRVDLSARLAEAMELEWKCNAELQDPDAVKELATDIKKRFPDLPLAKDADKALHGEMPQPLVKKDAGPSSHGP